MRSISLKKGLNLNFSLTKFPIPSLGKKKIYTQEDFPGLKLKPLVHVGQKISFRDTLLEDKKYPDVKIKAFFTGKVLEVVLGEKRRFERLVVERDEGSFFDEGADLQDYQRVLLETSLWTLFRKRPFEIIPSPGESLDVLFIQGIDSYPGSHFSFQELVKSPNFQEGFKVLRKLFKKVFYIGQDLGDYEFCRNFQGPHPSGLIGTHIHFLYPVSEKRSVLHLQVEDVANIGRYFLTREVRFKRQIFFQNELMKLEIFDDLSAFQQKNFRFIVGHPLFGHEANFLSMRKRHLYYVPEVSKEPYFSWLRPMTTYSKYQFFSSRNPSFTTSTQGEERSFIPFEVFYNVFPLKLEIQWLLRAIISQQEDLALDLGLLELAEEDLALVTYVDPSKNDYMTLARNLLDKIKEQL